MFFFQTKCADESHSYTPTWYKHVFLICEIWGKGVIGNCVATILITLFNEFF